MMRWIIAFCAFMALSAARSMMEPPFNANNFLDLWGFYTGANVVFFAVSYTACLVSLSVVDLLSTEKRRLSRNFERSLYPGIVGIVLLDLLQTQLLKSTVDILQRLPVQ